MIVRREEERETLIPNWGTCARETFPLGAARWGAGGLVSHLPRAPSVALPSLLAALRHSDSPVHPLPSKF